LFCFVVVVVCFFLLLFVVVCCCSSACRSGAAGVTQEGTYQPGYSVSRFLSSSIPQFLDSSVPCLAGRQAQPQRFTL
ncbi:MAG TPA: hypothetical protein PKB07_09620, partial [Flavilitoribacter sp.]|nr:hypothetical protein [Flavilitoribacter sp.]